MPKRKDVPTCPAPARYNGRSQHIAYSHALRAPSVLRSSFCTCERINLYTWQQSFVYLQSILYLWPLLLSSHDIGCDPAVFRPERNDGDGEEDVLSRMLTVLALPMLDCGRTPYDAYVAVEYNFRLGGQPCSNSSESGVLQRSHVWRAAYSSQKDMEMATYPLAESLSPVVKAHLVLSVSTNERGCQ
jgi:hypothetical protein